MRSIGKVGWYKIVRYVWHIFVLLISGGIVLISPSREIDLQIILISIFVWSFEHPEYADKLTKANLMDGYVLLSNVKIYGLIHNLEWSCRPWESAEDIFRAPVMVSVFIRPSKQKPETYLNSVYERKLLHKLKTRPPFCESYATHSNRKRSLRNISPSFFKCYEHQVKRGNDSEVVVYSGPFLFFVFLRFYEIKQVAKTDSIRVNKEYFLA